MLCRSVTQPHYCVFGISFRIFLPCVNSQLCPPSQYYCVYLLSHLHRGPLTNAKLCATGSEWRSRQSAPNTAGIENSENNRHHRWLVFCLLAAVLRFKCGVFLPPDRSQVCKSKIYDVLQRSDESAGQHV